jgi:hypothetical protein
MPTPSGIQKGNGLPGSPGMTEYIKIMRRFCSLELLAAERTFDFIRKWDTTQGARESRCRVFWKVLHGVKKT